jgi:hypothetical protein
MCEGESCKHLVAIIRIENGSIVKKLSLTFIVLIWTAEFLIRAQFNGNIAKKKIVAIIMVLLVFN